MTVTTAPKLKKKLISQAIEVLKEARNHNEESGKKALFDDSSTLYLQILLKKIPKRSAAQMIKVNLPHSLLKDTDEVCLITGDTDKTDRKAETEPDVLHYKAMLDKHGVTQVSKIVTLRQLRTDYKPYADKQKLLAAYDVFLADSKIYECLPRVLGKFFYKKRKFPLKINMKTSNLKQQIEKALSMKMFYVTGNGNSCCSEVATLDMLNSEILANIMEMINTASKEMPGSWDNIKGIYLKTARSQSIPVYLSYGNPNDVMLPEERVSDEAIIDELSTKPNVSVKVHNDGRIELLTLKKSQETCLDEISEEYEENIVSGSHENKKKKKQESELKEKIIETGKSKTQKQLNDKAVRSEESIKEKNTVLDEDICVAFTGKKKNKSSHKKAQKNLDEEINESATRMSKKLKKENLNSLDENESAAISRKKSKKQKKNVFDGDICTAVPESNNIATKEISQGDSTKKSKKGKKKVKENSNESPLVTDSKIVAEDLPKKKEKLALKRKRELSESGTKEKESFLSFESPKQKTKKMKVEFENLKKQPLKNGRKKMLQQKAKKNFKA